MRRIILTTAAAVLAFGPAGAVWGNPQSAGPQSASPQSTGAGPATMAPDKAGNADFAALQGLLGRAVTGSDGERLGAIVDVVIEQGSERANIAVIDTGSSGGSSGGSGGGSGGGGKLVAVDYTLLEVEGDGVTLRTIGRAQVAAMPAFAYGDAMVSLGGKAGGGAAVNGAPGRKPAH